MKDIIVKKVDELNLHLTTTQDIAREVQEYFSFYAKDYRFLPKYRSGLWDGKIRLFDLRRKHLPSGLLVDLIRFCKREDYSISLESSLRLHTFNDAYSTFESELSLTPLDYQLDSYRKCLQFNRALVLSPTGSGKSYIIYLLVRTLLSNLDGQILISVPSVNLVKQIISDFHSYEKDDYVFQTTQELSSGKTRDDSKRVIVATWEMILQRKHDWYDPFSAFIIDEAHQVASPSLSKIISNMGHIPYRFGFTGTLNESKTNEMQCRAWLGPIIRTKTTRELIDDGILSNIKINAINLIYPKETSKIVCQYTYDNEIKFLLANEARNRLIIEKALSLKGNCLVLFNLLSHGKMLFDMANSMSSDKRIEWISGEVESELREDIRSSMETSDNVVLFATYGTLSFRSQHTKPF